VTIFCRDSSKKKLKLKRELQEKDLSNLKEGKEIKG